MAYKEKGSYAPKAPRVKRWVLAKGERAAINKGPGQGLLEITNDHLKNPKIIAALDAIEKRTGNKIFGLVVVEV